MMIIVNNSIYFFLGKVKEMFCPLDVNTGFVQLVGPISTIDLNNITVKSYPLTISFAPRTTIPSLIGNRLDESTENTCTYRGKRYNLVDVQLCSVANKGFLLPGDTKPPVAELILTFSPNSPASDLQELSGILLCVPIYDSGTPSHAEYLTQLIEQTIPSCKYTNLVGSDYEGADYQQIPNTSLTSCVKSCCGDTNCLAYTFRSGTCYLKNEIPSIKKGLDKSISAGTVDHNLPNKGATPSTCAVPVTKGAVKKTTKANATTLQSLFYSSSSDTTQTSLAYRTCFETMDKDDNPSSKSLYVVVFPHGARLTQAGYQQLLLQLQGTLLPYAVPPAIRGGDSTVKSYQISEEGQKIATEISKEGIIYASRISSCTDDFKNRFEYFTLPPLLPATSKNGSSASGFNTEQCPYYKTSQYKCVPFNQLTDLSGNYVIPGVKTLETIAYEQKQKQENQKGGDSSNSSLSTETMETAVSVVLGSIIAGLIFVKITSIL
jgi:hypothetical protein